jgi:glyoxylase-like metal-dependent hydrolase (beta-lactamase superfamily II)
MKVKRLMVGVYAANCYIVMDEDTRETAVIDPGGEADEIIAAADELKADVKYVLLTHGHKDHTGAASEVAEHYGAAIGINVNDARVSLPDFLEGKFYKEPELSLKDGLTVKLGEHTLRCIETPGHTAGGVSFLTDSMLFTGDTLFSGSIGRTDLGGGDLFTIIESIKRKLMTLPDDTIVLPGHGPQTTVKRERMSNPYL